MGVTRTIEIEMEAAAFNALSLLEHAGAISAEAAKTNADQQYARYHALIDGQSRAVDAEFEKVAKQLKKPAAPRGNRGKKS